jgi:hypothetical protein
MRSIILSIIAILVIFTNSFALTVKDVGEFAKQSIQQKSSGEFKQLMKKQLIQMRLMDRNYNWTNTKLERVADKLIDPNLSMFQVAKFIEKIVEANSQNEYLLRFLAVASTKKFKKLEAKIKSEGSTILPNVVAYALVLENMTKLMRDDWRLLESVLLQWPKVRKEINLKKHLNLFDKLKLASVESPIENIVEIQKEGVVPGSFLKRMLPINILEAVAFDVKLGGTKNAKAGYILSKYNPNGSEAKELLNNANAQWSSDYKAIVLGIPESEKWADLYSTWNLGFVSHYKYFPFVMAKLVIPQVANHYRNSGEYIYNRGIALYIHLHYSFLGRVDGNKSISNTMDWYEEEFYKLWGEVNYNSTKSYENLVESQL